MNFKRFIALTTLTSVLFIGFIPQSFAAGTNAQINNANYSNAIAVYNETLKHVERLKEMNSLNGADIQNLLIGLQTMYSETKTANSGTYLDVFELLDRTLTVVNGVEFDSSHEIRMLVDTMYNEGNTVISKEAATKANSKSQSINSSNSSNQMESTNSQSVNDVTANNVKTYKVNFKDIKGHWASEFVNLLAGKGAIGGYSDGTFKPDATITIGEFLSIAMGAVYPGSNKTAPTGEHWASGILDVAIEKGILSISDTSSKSEILNKNINRYQMAMILVKLSQIGLRETDTPDGLERVPLYMADYSAMSSTNQWYVARAYLNGFITGTDERGTFSGDSTGTRAEAATMVVRLIDRSARATVDLKKPVIMGNIYDNGYPTVEYSKKMSKIALKTAKVFQKNGKYYITATLPKLDPGMEWEFNYAVVNNKTGAETDCEDAAGTVYHQGGKTVTYLLNDTTASQVKSGFTMYITFTVGNENGSSAQISVNTLAKNYLLIEVLEGKSVTGLTEGQIAEKYDTTAIFAGWK